MATFEYPATDQRFNNVFNLAMSSYSPLVMNKILRIYQGFDGIKVLVDVGGGTGIILNMIVSRYPQIQGINHDLLHVVSEAPQYVGIEHAGGDMFVDVPKGDAIFMKFILHDWSDEYCLKLLKNRWKALPNHGKLIVMDSVLSSRPENNVTSQIVFGKDVFMLGQCTGGKERIQKQFEALASKSGFSGCELKCSAHCNWVMEFHKSS
ncbi:hypothetical protein K2173_022938 [Erythroxylum novogranatense]|uniref:O-methyltransferase C-terminal domain-containing protein n=1 Tax=Erythroxylum novogranatense TaxID=1862640 RepID=A0AAV8T9M4_9ROSI|nr:hypothetical protein K2173_022938 [Erythroxylum novogranatense]